jgi:hypothetical protein
MMQDIDRRDLVMGIAGASLLNLPVGKAQAQNAVTASRPQAMARAQGSMLADTVNVREFGSVGDGVADDTRAVQAALNSGATLIVLPHGHFRVSALLVPAGVEIAGRGSLLFYKGGLLLKGNNVVRGITLKGLANSGLAHAITISGVNGVIIDGVTFVSVAQNAVDIINSTDILVQNCKAYDIGRYGKIDPRREGCFVHAERSSRVVISQNPLIQRTYGHAAIFIRENNTDCSVCDNAIYDTFFRGIQVYSSGIERIVVNGNRIYRTGEINNTGSGVACNGIYVVTGSRDPSLVAISHNHIEQCAENGIEVLGAATVLNNVIKFTGYRNLKTPSKEGIFVESGAIVKNNVVVSATDKGIRHFSSELTRDMVIDGNVIIDAGSDGINLQVDGKAGRYVNCRVSNNQVISHKGDWSIAVGGTNGGLVDETNVVSGNIVPYLAQTFVAKTARAFGNSWQF